MLWWLSVAPFGNPVVPLVYWMLIGSSKLSSAARAASATVSTASAVGEERVPVRRTEVHDLLEPREARRHLVDHRAVVARLELGRGEESSTA